MSRGLARHFPPVLESGGPMQRRCALATLAAVSMSLASTKLRLRAQTDPAAGLMGSWHVTSAVTSIMLSLEPQGGALVLTIENGAHSLSRSKWRKLEGGLVVEGFPMFRLWAGRNAEEVRVEMEPLPTDVEISSGLRQFPGSFFMSRVRPGPREFLGRPLPKGWERAALDPAWDQSAGRRRPLK